MKTYENPKAYARIQQALTMAVSAMPYTTPILLGMNFIEDTRPIGHPLRVNTLAVDHKGNFFYAPEFVLGESVLPSTGLPYIPDIETLCVGLLHEVGHILYDHHGRRGQRSHQLWNVAGDREINDDLRHIEAHFRGQPFVMEMPSWAQFPDSPPLALPDHMRAEVYYAALDNQQDEDGEEPEGGGPGGDPEDKSLPVAKVGDKVKITQGPNKGRTGIVTKASPVAADGTQVVDVDLYEPKTSALLAMAVADDAPDSIVLGNDSFTIEGEDDGENGDGDDGDGEDGDGDGDDGEDGDGDGDGDGSGEGEGEGSGEGGEGSGEGSGEGGTTDGFGAGNCGGGAGGNPDQTDSARDWAREKGMLPVANQKSERDMDKMRESTATAIQNHVDRYADDAGGGGWGGIPGGMRRRAEELNQAAKLTWVDYLRSSVTEALTTRAQDEISRARLHKRSEGYRGAPVRFAMRGREFNICVVVDTSGSVSRAALSLAITELAELLANGDVTGIDLIATDSVAQEVERIFDADDIADNLIGGGGTDLDEGFAAAENLDPLPTFTVMFTDGQFPGRGQQGGWPASTLLEDILIVIVPAWNDPKPDPGLLAQAEEAAEYYVGATVIGLNLEDYSGPE